MNDDIQDRLNNTVALLKRANSQLHDRGEGSELGDAIVDVLDECRQYIERLRGIVATFVEGDSSGYFPFVAKDFNGIAEVLVQIFRDDDGLMTCQLAHRDDHWATWSPPTPAEVA